MESSSKRSSLNVIIIGGGLVGSVCACLMAKRGHNVDLYEYRGDIRHVQLAQGRSINLSMSARARAALRIVGLEDYMVNKHGIPMKARMIHSLNGDLRSIPYDSRTNQSIYSVGRKHLNEILLSAAEEYPNVRLFFNHKLVNANLRDGRVTLLQTNTKKTVEVFGDLIVGADGAFSAVRRIMMKEELFDFSQTYIEHGYMELCIPADNNKFAMEPNYLHIWPRGEFMMIALPNQDKTWTVTLFMPFNKFKSLETPEGLLEFFRAHFPDAVPLIGEKRLVTDFFKGHPSPLVSVKCHPYHVQNKALIIGDAAHAMVPFYGQGMNAGFEDCCILDRLMEEFDADLNLVLPEFTRRRREDAAAICDLAMYNYIEMRDLVTRRTFRIRKKLDDILFWLCPTLWVPLYNSVTFTDMGYAQCARNRHWQDQIIKKFFWIFTLSCLLMIGLYFTMFQNGRSCWLSLEKLLTKL